MTKRMLIDAAHREETRVVVADGTQIDDFDFESEAKKQIKGNIYLARVTRVEPSLQAAFVEYGGNRHGFLAFSEIHPDYYQIPVADREKLLQLQADAEAKRAEADAARDDAEAEEAPDDEDVSDDDTEDEDDESEDSDDDIEGDEVSDDEDATDEDEGDEEPTPRSIALASSSAETLETDAPELDAEDAATDSDVYEDVDGGEDSTDENIDAESSEDDDEVRSGRTRRRGRRGGRRRESRSEREASQGESSNRDGRSSGGRRGGRSSGRSSSRSSERSSGRSRNRRDDDDMDDLDRDPRPFFKNYKIQEVMRRRQILLVQVVKEERGNKGAALTTYLSLAGRYCVLMPNTARGGGISRKITNMSDRRRLKSIVSEFDVPKGMGLIVRTAGANRTKAEIRRDYDYLIRLWETIRDLTLKSSAPSLIYEEGNLIKRSIRDLYTKDLDEVLVEGKEAHKEAKAFMRMLMPSHARNVKLYTERVPLFQRYHVDEQLDSMLSPRVDLPAGGYIIINQTEALVSVDVNSGRSTREHSIENTALKTNLEAATELARQLRMRDLAGLIVIDFIDMEENRNNRAVERRLKECLEQDRARLQVGRISNFGLLEMSRQRLRAGILEGSTRPCPHCEGAGIIRSVESAALRIIRACGEEGVRERSASITVRTNRETAEYLLNHKRRQILEFEDLYGMATTITVDIDLYGDEFVLERGEALSEARRDELRETESVSLDTAYLTEEDKADEAAAIAAEAEDKAAEEEEKKAEPATASETEASDGDGDGEDEQGTRRRRRGRRGGKRNRRRRERLEGDGEPVAASEPASENASSSDAANGAEKPEGRGQRKRASRPRRRRSSSNRDATSEATANADTAKARSNGRGNGRAAPKETVERTSTAKETVPAGDAPAKSEKKGWWQKKGWFN